MESLVNLMPYSSYRRFFLRYQIGASVLVCLPIFLSIFTLIGLPHLFFVVIIALLDKETPRSESRILHGFMFLYYGVLLFITLYLWPEIVGIWIHSDSIDLLIQVQMMLLPLVLIVQLGLIVVEWIYPALKPHELLDQQMKTKKLASNPYEN